MRCFHITSHKLVFIWCIVSVTKSDQLTVPSNISRHTPIHSQFLCLPTSENYSYGLLPTNRLFQQRYERELSSFEKSMIDSLPLQYNLRTTYNSCLSLTTILQQHTCGACWAFGATGIVADRLCIAGIANILPSAQFSVNCDRTCSLDNTRECNIGCNGGYLGPDFEFTMNHFVTTNSCVPYTNTEQPCTNSCSDGTPFQPGVNAFSTSGIRHICGEEAIRLAIFTSGSVSAGLEVYSDFEEYREGVYIRSPTSYLKGRHAVKIIGWGVERDGGGGEKRF